jgi:uroporphyrin-III C-methyltransferase
MKEQGMPPNPHGAVQLVGAGPGAADLLTLRALRAIEAADIILIDALVGEEVRALIGPKARVIDVGKRAHRPSPSQDFINRLMVRYAKSGARVVRLKGGDPSLFGRAAEERAFLEQRGILVEVIAGVTTASAAAAQFSFSLTERGVARRVVFAAGRAAHCAELDWSAVADSHSTLCLYMGCAEIETIVQRQLAAGRAGETPALAAIDVERPGACMIQSTLAQLPHALANAPKQSPILIVIGAVSAAARPVSDARSVQHAAYE